MNTELPGPQATVLPPETADVEALERLADFRQLPVLRTGRYEQQSSRDRGQDNLVEDTLLPLLANGNRDLNNFMCKSRDAELGPPRLLPYHFDQELCPEAYVRGAVLARFEGSGSLQRFWMTVSSLAATSGALGSEMLRVYVDDRARPLFQVPLVQVLDGSADEIFAPPFGAGSRHFIAWYYPVVFAHKLVIALDRLSSDYYFQADVVFDAEPKPRTAPRARLSQRDAARAQLSAGTPLSSEATALHSEHVTLSQGESKVVHVPGPATIEELRLRVAAADLPTLNSVQLSVRWDAAAQPALELPLAELFAAGRSPVAQSSLALASASEGDSRVLALRLPMPFRSDSEWTLQLPGTGHADFQLEWLGVRSLPQAEFGRLHVQRSQVPPTTLLDRSVVQVTGRGRYVGLCADLAGHPDPALVAFQMASPLNLLEGDFRATVDGRLALDGTGAEDYPDNSFYFLDSPKATPFAQNWGLVNDAAANPPGQASYCRWQVLGGEVDFAASFEATMEISHRDPAIVDLHRTVVFLYLP